MWENGREEHSCNIVVRKLRTSAEILNATELLSSFLPFSFSFSYGRVLQNLMPQRVSYLSHSSSHKSFWYWAFYLASFVSEPPGFLLPGLKMACLLVLFCPAGFFFTLMALCWHFVIWSFLCIVLDKKNGNAAHQHVYSYVLTVSCVTCIMFS